jgi:hypothetical protein
MSPAQKEARMDDAARFAFYEKIYFYELDRKESSFLGSIFPWLS